jgi:hypothetical protein
LHGVFVMDPVFQRSLWISVVCFLGMFFFNVNFFALSLCAVLCNVLPYFSKILFFSFFLLRMCVLLRRVCVPRLCCFLVLLRPVFTCPFFGVYTVSVRPVAFAGCVATVATCLSFGRLDKISNTKHSQTYACGQSDSPNCTVLLQILSIHTAC